MAAIISSFSFAFLACRHRKAVRIGGRFQYNSFHQVGTGKPLHGGYTKTYVYGGVYAS